MKTQKLFFLLLFLAMSIVGQSQRITVEAENYKQIYEGGGVSYGLYKGHIWSLPETEQNEFFALLFRDIKMKYVQYYAKKNPYETDANKAEYDKVAKFMNKSLVHNKDLDLIFVLGSFPTDLTYKKTVGDTEYDVLDIESENIYGRVAQWMLDMMNAMHERGTPIDIFSMANEPDFSGKWDYGYEDANHGLGVLIQHTIPALKELLTDASKNPYSLSCPPILAPAAIGPGGCKNYITNWRDNIPDAWAQVDIVGTHQYINGDSWEHFGTINSMLDGRKFLQTEQHTNKGDGLGNLPITSPHRGILSLTSMFSTAVNNGVESWFYFVANYPNTYHNGGLMQTKYGGGLTPYKTYYAFKQLNSIQSDKSHVTGRVLTDGDKLRVISFRKKGEKKVVLHIANADGASANIMLDAKGETQAFSISAYKTWLTDNNVNIEEKNDITFENAVKEIAVSVPPYSLMSVELTLDENISTTELQAQTITFDAIEDKKLDAPSFELSAQASSGLPIEFQIVSGNAKLEGNTVTITSIGKVTILASQGGNSSYFEAPSVTQSFNVAPSHPNIAVNKPIEVSSVYKDGTKYPAEKMVDGDKVSDASRWLSSDKIEYPQWVEIDLQSDFIVNGFGVWTGYGSYKNPLTKFKVQAWNGSAWYTILSETQNGNPEYLAKLEAAKTNKIRLEIEGSDGKPIRIFEIEVYGYKIETENIALNKTVTTSSEKTDATGAKAVDGDKIKNESRWISADNEAFPHWIEVDLETEHAIEGIAFWTGYDGYNRAMQNFKFELLQNDEWVEVFKIENNESPSFFKLFDKQIASKARLTFTGTEQEAIRLYELEIYGSTKVELKEQTITFDAIENKKIDSPAFELSAQASSGLPVSFQVISGNATVEGNTVTITGLGEVIIEASQSGNGTYAAAESVTQTFTVESNALSVSFSKEQSIKIYPNPVIQDELWIDGIAKIKSVQVYNSHGVLQNCLLTDNKLSVHELPSGTYLLRINNNITLTFIK